MITPPLVTTPAACGSTAEMPLTMAEKRLEKSARRRSVGIFGSSHLSSSIAATPDGATHDRSSSDGLSLMKKKPRRSSTFFGGRDSSPVHTAASATRPQSAQSEVMASANSIPREGVKGRRKSFQLTKRSSVFGSLRSLHSLEDEENAPSGHRSKDSSLDGEDAAHKKMLGHVALHHGEVQTTGSMWRKRSHYLVLTDTHLIRFKSQSRASELFPSITNVSGRVTPVSRQSIVSISSLQEQNVSSYSSDIAGIALNSIVSVCGVDDGRSPSAVELSYLDERTNKPAFMAIQLADSEERNLWLIGIRSAAESSRSVESLPFERKAVEHAVRVLEQDRDYDPQHFHLFRVVQRYSTKQMGRASSDDLAKLSPVVCHLAIGLHKVHLIPLPKPSSRASLVSLNELDMGASFGLMAMTALSMHPADDSFQLSFRVPLRSTFSLYLASVHSVDIALWIRQRTEFLRPLWVRQPYDLVALPEIADEDIIPDVALDEDFECFDRTLIAYSASYGIDTSNIRYSIDLECEDAPCFNLLPPSANNRQKYTALELLAVMRALRYNESFVSLSFSEINLDVLQGYRDPYGLDLDAYQSRSGMQLNIAGQDRLSVLSQEIRALALKSRRLRRLDFSFCLTRTPLSDSGVRDPGCGIPEAIFPLCRRQLTNVDWIVLNGIKLGDSDLDYLVDAASQRTSHFRALEVGNCGLSVHDLDLILSTLAAQETTLEAVNISGVQGRLSPELFHQQIGYFGHIRKIDLSRVARTSGPEPLIAPETLLNWRLEELSLSQTVVNQQTVDSIAAYLASDRSSSLRILRFDQCGLTGRDVATFLRCMTRAKGTARDLHLYVSENHLDTDYALLFETIADNHTPSHLTMRMIDFKKEEHFRELIHAMRKNTTLKYLDISKASLPYDAEPETCEALQLMFEENETLEELDISGEYAHLDVTRFGIGLNQALTGLKKNKHLKMLRIEHQKLGLPGASTLASVLEENKCLREVYCEHNDINLQSFTVLVNGLKRNQSVIFLPSMDSDRQHSLEKVRREVEGVNRDTSIPPSSSTASSIRRSIHAAIAVGHPSGGHKLSKPTTAQKGALAGSHVASQHIEPLTIEVEHALHSLDRKWDNEVTRLHQYLYRNYCLLHGLPYEPDEIESVESNRDRLGTARDRPATSGSLLEMIDGMKQLDLHLAVQELGPRKEESEFGAGVATLQNEAKELSGESSGYSSPIVTMSSGQSTHTADSLTIMNSSQSRTLSPALLSSESLTATPPKDYSASSTSSLQLAKPVPAFRTPLTVTGSIRSKGSSSNLSTSTNTEAQSVRSTTESATSSLRKLLTRRPSAMRGIRQINGLENSQPDSKKSPVVDDKPPQIIWSPPQVDL